MQSPLKEIQDIGYVNKIAQTLDLNNPGFMDLKAYDFEHLKIFGIKLRLDDMNLYAVTITSGEGQQLIDMLEVDIMLVTNKFNAMKKGITKENAVVFIKDQKRDGMIYEEGLLPLEGMDRQFEEDAMEIISTSRTPGEALKRTLSGLFVRYAA